MLDIEAINPLLSGNVKIYKDIYANSDYVLLKYKGKRNPKGVMNICLNKSKQIIIK